MGKINVDGYTQEFSGRVGPHVFRRRQDGALVASIRPRRNDREPTAAQALLRSRFTRVANRIKAVLAKDPDAAARYEALARETKKTAFNLAFVDYYKRPFVDKIDLAAYRGQVGDPIGIVAADGDARVIEVNVLIRDLKNEALVIEQGAATRTGDTWSYTATAAKPAESVAVVVEVTAKDYLDRATTETEVYA